MARLYKFIGYVSDVNEEFQSAEDYISYIYNTNDVHIHVFDCESQDIEWDDDIDINKMNCTKEQYDKYFNTER